MPGEWGWAESLLRAEKERVAIAPLSSQDPQLTVENAYAVQELVVQEKIRQGHTVVGHKVGLTSAPMQAMFGVNEPDFGHLLSDMRYESGSTIDFPLLQPKVEPEIAFVLKRDLLGPGITWQDVMSATECVTAALEVIDSRIENWGIRLVDTVADNASAGCFVMNTELHRPMSIDLALQGLVMAVNGDVMATGSGAAVMSHPAHAVAWLGNKLGEFGTPLRAGHVILSGSISAAVPVGRHMHVVARIGRLGTVEAYFA